MSSNPGTVSAIPQEQPRSSLVQVLDKSWKVDAAGVLLVGLLSLGGYFAGLGPYLGAKLDKASHDLALSAARGERDDAKANAETFARRLAETRAQTKSVELELQSVQKRHTHVGNISRLAAESGLVVDQVSPGEPKAVSGVQKVVCVPVTLSGKGSYEHVSDFMRRLHVEHRDTSVESVKLLAEPGSGGEVAVFSVSLLWFAKPDEPTGTSGGTARAPE